MTEASKVLSYEGMQRAIEVISDKWATLVLGAIRDGDNRFGALQRRLPDISKKMLTQTLRRLERNGVIQRIDYDEIPPRVEYTFTPLGESLGEHLNGLCHWGNRNLNEIELARETYDGSQDGWV